MPLGPCDMATGHAPLQDVVDQEGEDRQQGPSDFASPPDRQGQLLAASMLQEVSLQEEAGDSILLDTLSGDLEPQVADQERDEKMAQEAQQAAALLSAGHQVPGAAEQGTDNPVEAPTTVAEQSQLMQVTLSDSSSGMLQPTDGPLGDMQVEQEAQVQEEQQEQQPHSLLSHPPDSCPLSPVNVTPLPPPSQSSSPDIEGERWPQCEGGTSAESSPDRLPVTIPLPLSQQGVIYGTPGHPPLLQTQVGVNVALESDGCIHCNIRNNARAA
jgi:hypothetical protein